MAKGQIQGDVDAHDRDGEGHAEALAQHAGIHATLRAGALVQGLVCGAAQGDQLGWIAQRALVLAEGEGGPLVIGGVGRKPLLPWPLEGVFHIALGGGSLRGGLRPVLLDALKAALVLIPAHHQIRIHPARGQINHRLDGEILFVGRRVDHLILRVHDVLAVEGRRDDIGIPGGVGDGAFAGRAVPDGHKHIREGLSQHHVQVLDDVVAIALLPGIDLDVQMHLVIFIRCEPV